MSFKKFFQKIKNAWLDNWDDVGVKMGEEIPPHRRERWRRRHLADGQDAVGNNLMDKINNASAYDWTEEELNEWIESLDDYRRRALLASAKRIADAGQDVMTFLCRARHISMRHEQEEQASKRANRLPLRSVLWAWDEARLMSAQREYFDRENKKARGG